MSDLIDRQAAIEAICKASCGASCGMPCDEIFALEELSSSQQELIRCKDCEYGVKDDNGEWYCRGFGCRVGDEDGNGFCSDGERRR